MTAEKTGVYEPSQIALNAFVQRYKLDKPTNGTIEEKRAFLVKICNIGARITEGTKVEQEYIRLAEKAKTLSVAQIDIITGGAL